MGTPYRKRHPARLSKRPVTGSFVLLLAGKVGPMPADKVPHELAPGLAVRMPERQSVAPARPRQSPEERWENEGGTIPPPSQSPRAAPRPAPSTGKQPQDTVAGCRHLAEKDLVRALGTDTVHGRLKFEHSAAIWTQRGDLLEDLAGRRRRSADARSPA